MAATSVGAADVLAYQPLLQRAFPLPDLGSAGLASPPCGRVGEWASGSSGGRAVAVSGRAVRSAWGGASRGRWGGGGWLYGRRVVGRSGDGIVACVARARCACARRARVSVGWWRWWGRGAGRRQRVVAMRSGGPSWRLFPRRAWRPWRVFPRCAWPWLMFQWRACPSPFAAPARPRCERVPKARLAGWRRWLTKGVGLGRARRHHVPA